MDENNKIFYQYKILVQLQKQISFDGLMNADIEPRIFKNNVLRKIFDILKDSEDFIEFDSNGRLISVKKEHVYNEEILAFRLARKKDVSFTKKEEDFVNDVLPDYPNSLVFFDVKAQTFYVEKNYKVFQKPNEINKILGDLLYYLKKEFTEFSDVDFLLNVIVDQQEFIDCFMSFDVVNRVSLKLNSPNSFLGNQKADDLLNELREDTNAQETKIEVMNKESGINADGFLRQFKDLFEYAVNGGGEWSLNGKEKGRNTTKKSTAKGKTIILNVNINNLNVNSNDIVQVLEKENRYEKD